MKFRRYWQLNKRIVYVFLVLLLVSNVILNIAFFGWRFRIDDTIYHFNTVIQILILAAIWYGSFYFKDQYVKYHRFFNNSYQRYFSEYNSIDDPQAKNAFNKPLGRFIETNKNKFSDLNNIMQLSDIIKFNSVLAILFLTISLFDAKLVVFLSDWDASWYLMWLIDFTLGTFVYTLITSIILYALIINYKDFKEKQNNIIKHATKSLSIENRLIYEKEILSLLEVKNTRELNSLILSSK